MVNNLITKYQNIQIPAESFGLFTLSMANGRIFGFIAISLFSLFLLFFSYFPLFTLNFQFADAATIKSPVINLGLVSHWTIDGGDITNGRINDVAGTNHGNVKNIATSTFYSRGRLGQAGNFDGSDDYINVPYNANLNITGPLTVSLWFKLDSLNPATNRYSLVARTDGTTVVNYAMGFNITGSGVSEGTGRLDFVTWSSGGCVCGSYTTMDFSSAANLGQWFHAVGTWDGAAWHTYINGVEDSNNNWAPIVGPFSYATDALTIGNQNMGSGTFGRYIDGQIDDVRIYNRALSATEITRLYDVGRLVKITTTQSTGSLSSGLVGHWTFDGKNITSGRIDDASGNANHGNTSGIATSTFYTRGVIGQAGNFDGTNDYVAMANSASWDFGTSDFAISLWVKPTSFSGYNGLVSGSYHNGAACSNGWSLYTNTTGVVRLSTNCAVSDLVTSVSAMTLNAWNHVLIVRNGTGSTGLNIYINGVAGSSPASGNVAINTAGSGIVLGRYYAATLSQHYFDGQMDDVRVYSRALSQAEITRLYTMGSPSLISKSLIGGLSSGLVGYWTFDGKDTVTGAMVDASGNGNTGNFVTIATSTFYTRGKIGQAGNFDGTSDDVSIPNSSSFDFGSADFAVSWWEYRTANDNGKAAMTRDYFLSGGVGYTPFIFGYSAAGANLLCYMTSNGTSWDIANGKSFGAVTLNTWNHFVITRNGTTFTTYKNGAQVDTWTSALAIKSGTTAMHLGTYKGGEASYYYFTGKMDDVRFYNRAFSASEVLKLYNMGR